MRGLRTHPRQHDPQASVHQNSKCTFTVCLVLPGQVPIIELPFQEGLDHLKMRRHVEVARGEQAVMADVQDLPNAVPAAPARFRAQGRSNERKNLSQQRCC